MNILDEIIRHKRQEVHEAKRQRPLDQTLLSSAMNRKCYSLRDAIRSSRHYGIIAEIKRQSPSKGLIHTSADPGRIAKGYQQAGAAAISVLTDHKFFGGQNADLEAVRDVVTVPVLRKEFIVDEYQIYEARLIGADVILLIAAALTSQEILDFVGLAHQLGLEVLLEVHDLPELEINKSAGADLIGVNNRSLKTFKVDLDISREIIKSIPSDVPAISESGIENREAIYELSALGYAGFLIGQRFMEQSDPGKACVDFIGSLNHSK
jgi:indole-3-glycerol phosphate synthase